MVREKSLGDARAAEAASERKLITSRRAALDAKSISVAESRGSL